MLIQYPYTGMQGSTKYDIFGTTDTHMLIGCC